MMLPTDLALITDPTFKKYVEIYASDRDKFYEDFADVFAKLIELGVDRSEPVSHSLTSLFTYFRWSDWLSSMTKQYESAPPMSKEAGEKKEAEAKAKI